MKLAQPEASTSQADRDGAEKLGRPRIVSYRPSGRGDLSLLGGSALPILNKGLLELVVEWVRSRLTTSWSRRVMTRRIHRARGRQHRHPPA